MKRKQKSVSKEEMSAEMFKRFKSVIPRQTNIKTREEWLTEFVNFMRPTFQDIKNPLPDKIRIACGWPRASRSSIGQCWSAKASKDGTIEIFVSPAISDAPRICDVVIHELVHAALPDGTKHGPEFRKIALLLGLKGRMRATVATPELAEALGKFTPAHLGQYPHSMLSPAGNNEKQTTRMIKLTCQGCGMVIRTTRKWIDEIGAPNCACGKEFGEEEGE